MRLRRDKKKSLSELVVQKAVMEFVVLLIVIFGYIGYVFIDDMFINKAADRQKKIAEMKEAIAESSAQIKKYNELWSKMIATGDDKKVVSGLTFSKVESMFKGLEKKFDISGLNVYLVISDAAEIVQSVKMPKMPKGTNLVLYRFRITGMVAVETDLYNMMVFVAKNFPGVVFFNKMVIEVTGESPADMNAMSRVKLLGFDIGGDWFFLSSD